VVIGISVLATIATLFSLAETYLYKVVFDEYLLRIDTLSRETFIRGISLTIGLWIGAAMISRIAKNIQTYQTKVLGDLAGLRIYERAYDHAIGLSLNYHETKKTGEVVRQLSKAREDIAVLFNSFFDKFIVHIISFVLVTSFFFYIQWQIAVVMLFYLPIFILITKYLAQNINAVQDKINTRMENISGSTQQAMDSIMVVQSFNNEAVEKNRLRANNQITHAALKLKTIAWQKLAFSQGTLINLARLSIVAAGSYFVYTGDMTVGEVLLLSIWAFWIYQPMYEISELYALFKESFNSIDRIRKLLDIPAVIKNPETPHTAPTIAGNVEFKDVVFAYPEHDNVINGINFSARSGQQIAIVGPSGAGKSTITKLLTRFYDIQSGQILVDGVDIREWDINQLRRAMGLVLQETTLFNDTVFNNIRYGNVDATREQVEQAAQEAYCHDFIVQLPQGYDTVVGERGIKLSGGEKQRISLARTILSNPHILILDEATSSLDSESEVIVQNAINRISKNLTTIAIAHRLSTIMDSDEILFFEDGKIQERGTHDELIKLGGNYKRYVDLQKKKENIEGKKHTGPVQTQMPV